MKNNNFYTALFILLTISMLGCKKDLLDTTSYGQVTSNTFYKNATDAVLASNALYALLEDEMFFGHPEQVWDVCSDDQWRSGDWGNEQALEEFTFDASNPQFGWSWSMRYEIISRANAILLNVPKISSMDKALQDRIVGEAYFMRGFMYWQLYKYYGQVPLITDDNVVKNTYNVAKGSISEVENRIEADLIKAADLLMTTNDADNIGRATKGAAWGYLSKLYLYKENFAKAIEYGSKVIAGPYRLASNFGDNFEPETDNNAEMLFAVQQISGGWTGDNNASWYYAPRHMPWDGWGFQEPTDDLVSEFEPNDPRLGYSVARNGDIIQGGSDGQPFMYDSLEMSGKAGHYFKKYTKLKLDGTGMNHDLEIPLLRTADIYLVVAEAKIRSSQSGDVEINAVRSRAGLPAVSGAKMPALIHERRVELAGENERHLDLVRWDKAKIVDIVALYARDRGQWKRPRTFSRPKHYYFPLPQREIDLSNGVLKQNPNY